MKIATLFFLLAFHLLIHAQTRETYYSYEWEPVANERAVFYSHVEKTDSGWLQRDYYMGNRQLQMRGLFKDSACKIKNGHFIWLYSNGYPSAIGKLVDNKQEGICFSFHRNGMMSDSAFFKQGKAQGVRLMWHSNGYISDSIKVINDSTNVWVSWFNDGQPSSAGYVVHGKKNGKWNYFHHNGVTAAKVLYAKDSVITGEFFNEDGTAFTDLKKVNRKAGFKKGGDEGWRNYLQKNLYWPHDVKLAGEGAVTVSVYFVINEEGKIEDAVINTPVHPAFDNIALKIIKNSPAWEPAIHFNRKIKAYRIQPMTFAQQE